MPNDSGQEGTSSDTVARFSYIASAIQARHISTPVALAVTVENSAPSVEAADKLTVHQFDHAPVVDHERNWMGRFDASRARQGLQVDDVMVPLGPRLMVSGDTPIADMARYLAREAFLFLLSGRSIAGFVTPADMGKPEARTYFYLLLADLEVSLAAYVRGLFHDQEQALSLLSSGRRRTYENLVGQLREEDKFLDSVSALGLVDLLAIAAKTPLRAAVEQTGTSWRTLERGLGEFRNDVMHPVRDFSEPTRQSMDKLSRRVSSISVVAQQARISAVVDSEAVG